MGYTSEYRDHEQTRAEVDALTGAVLVEFGAPWCPHCQAIQSALEALLRENPDIQHIKIYDGKGQPLGRSFRVKLWPNLVFMRDGKVLMQMARPKPEEIRQGVDALAGDA